MLGYLREDGSKGIRNITAVVYLVECAHHVAREIVLPFRDQNVHLIGFSGCYPNAHASTIVRRLCTHPNVGAVLLVSLGCESFIRRPVEQAVRDSGRPLETLTIQQVGGTRQSIERGRQWIEDTLPVLAAVPRIEMAVSDLIIGTICGGSDATSGMTANPAIGAAFDRFIDEGAACIFEETGELIGCEQFLSRRAATPELGQAMVDSIRKAERYYDTLGHGSFASGNSLGELTTQEEKSLGAYCKSGTRPISGLLHPGDQPPGGGLYLLDVVPDGEVRYGFPNINDNLEITELIACGSHVTLFATGPWLSRRLRDRPSHQNLRQSADLPSHERGHGCERWRDPRRHQRPRSRQQTDLRPHRARRQREAQLLRSSWPPGILRHLQVL